MLYTSSVSMATLPIAQLSPQLPNQDIWLTQLLTNTVYLTNTLIQIGSY